MISGPFLTDCFLQGPECCDDACDAAPTSFPQIVGLAASFNATLWRTVGETISTEARAIANYNTTLTGWVHSTNRVCWWLASWSHFDRLFLGLQRQNRPQFLGAQYEYPAGSSLGPRPG